ncbi:MAG: lytic transglycosylase domain-containing protein [Neisseriaceae bacterium]|nr:lytic transglycosylase domain-containing protein [Neisseriaceae bacterium]
MIKKPLLLLLTLFTFQAAYADYTTDCLKGKKHSAACKRMLNDYWKYNDLIEKIGREEGIDPALLKALIAYESAYNTKAVSSAKAKGLTQVIAGTAKQHGVHNSQYLHIPEVSIRTGAKELAKQWKKYKRLDLTLAAYNAGPGAVDKYNGVPPYKETRAYVKNITRLYAEFKAAEKRKGQTVKQQQAQITPPPSVKNITPVAKTHATNPELNVAGAKFEYNAPQMQTVSDKPTPKTNKAIRKTKKSAVPQQMAEQKSAFREIVAN